MAPKLYHNRDGSTTIEERDKYKELISKAQNKERERQERGGAEHRKASRVQPPRKVTLHPHSLRHFYAYLMYYRNWYGNRKDITDLRDLLGHQCISTTNIYLVHESQVVDNDRDWIRVMNGNGLEYRSIFSRIAAGEMK